MDNDEPTTTNLPVPKNYSTRFQPGVSGNPAGRGHTPSKFSKRFLVSLSASWEKHGDDVLEYVRRNDPTQYLRICASLIPRQINVTTETRPMAQLSEQELLGIIVEDVSKLDQVKMALEPMVDRVAEFDPILADDMRKVLDV
jgi:hypothetical protein